MKNTISPLPKAHNPYSQVRSSISSYVNRKTTFLSDKSLADKLHLNLKEDNLRKHSMQSSVSYSMNNASKPQSAEKKVSKSNGHINYHHESTDQGLMNIQITKKQNFFEIGDDLDKKSPAKIANAAR